MKKILTILTNTFNFLETKDLILIQVITLITIFAWKDILYQTPEGEAFIYFTPTYQLFDSLGNIELFYNIDNFTRLFYFVFDKLFSYNMFPFMLGIFIGVILINISLYIFAKLSTQSFAIAFLTSLYAGINFQGNFQFYARGHIHWFLQRVPEIIPMFISVLLLFHFLKTKKRSAYYLSLLFFILSLLTAHYATMITPFIPIYLTLYALKNSKNKHSILKTISLSIPFLIVNYLLIKTNSLGDAVINSGNSFSSFLLNSSDLLKKILFQLTSLTLPFPLVNLFTKITKTDSANIVTILFYPTLIFYLLIFYRLFKTKSKHFIFALSCFLTLLVTLFLNLFLGRFGNVYNQIAESRYYYLPAIYVGFIFAITIDNLFSRFQSNHFINLKTVIITCLSVLLIFMNIKPIWKKTHASQYRYTALTKMFQYLSHSSQTFPPNSLIFIPNPPGPNTIPYLEKKFGSKNTTYFYFDPNWQPKLPSDTDPNKVFVLSYSDEFKKGGGADLSQIHVIDQSKLYREQLIQKK